MSTKIKLPDNYQVFTFDGGIKGTLVNPVEVEFNCSEEALAEHFAAKGLNDLVSLLDSDEFTFHPVTAEKMPVVVEEVPKKSKSVKTPEEFLQSLPAKPKTKTKKQVAKKADTEPEVSNPTETETVQEVTEPEKEKAEELGIETVEETEG